MVADEDVLIESNDPLSGEGRLKLNELMILCTNLQTKVLELEKTKSSQQIRIESLERKVKKLERSKKTRTHKLKSLYKVGMSARVISLDNEETILGDQEDASKQGRKIADIDENADITLVDEGMGRNENLKEDEVTLAQTLQKIKSTTPMAKGIVIREREQEKPLKLSRKEHIRFDEQEARRLQAQFDKEARIANEEAQRIKEANLALIEEWNNIQAKIDADYELAQRLQQQEQEELTDAEKSKLFVQLLEARKKHFAAKRAEEQRSKPPTKA
ncbi:hypothetical protein Tco_1174130 [Tanacetum coccineum]